MAGDKSEVGRWEALIGLPGGFEHADAVVDGLPEDAVYAAMARGFQKYGGGTDYAPWRMRAEWVSEPRTARTVHMRFHNGALERIPRPPASPPPARKRRPQREMNSSTSPFSCAACVKGSP